MVPSDGGSLMDVSVSTAPIFDVDGRVGGAMGIIADITDRKRAERELAAQTRLLRTILDTTPDLVILKDVESVYKAVNLAFCGFVRRSESDIIGKTDYDLFPREEAESYRKGDLEVVRTLRPLLRDEEVTSPEGRRWMSVAKTPVLGSEGECVGVLVTVRDVTGRKQAEASLAEERDRAQDYLDIAGVTLVAIGANQRVTLVNKKGCTLLGVPEEEILGKNWFDHFIPERQREEVRSVFLKLIAGDLVPAEYHENPILTATGQERLIAWHNTFLRDTAGAIIGTLSSGEDITDRRRAEEERRRLEDQVRQSQKLESLGILAGGIAHDFNNLLTGILGNASLALVDLPDGSPEQQSVEQIERAALRAAELTNQMLAYAGKGAFVIKRVGLSGLFRDLSDLLKSSASKKVAVQYRLMDNMPAILADVAQMRQVTMNLIINASEAVGDREGLISIATGVTEVTSEFLDGRCLGEGLAEGLHAYLEVSDTGCGMDAETKSKVFDPFFTTKFTGRGLGLAATLGIVRGHHGAIKVVSEPGRGTTFTLVFPVVDADAGDVSVADRREEGASVLGGTILVVDDEESIRVIATRALERAGFDVLTASDGHEAVKVFREHAEIIDVILLDRTMPGMDGREVLDEVRQIRPGARVVLFSGYGEQEASKEFAEFGLSGFIQKPYQAGTLVSKVLDAI
ncbi:MAG: PAS domain S-box protein [Phycisphaerae bacterium]|nr:PAS domain S-box protein [Phycisphaerae bacterium]